MPLYTAKAITVILLGLQTSITVKRHDDGVAGGAISVCPFKSTVWCGLLSDTLPRLNRKSNRTEAARGRQKGTPIQRCWWDCDSSQWDSILGQGAASSSNRLFKSFFWLSCPFGTMNARRKAPAILWMSWHIIHGWQTGEQVVVKSVCLVSVQCHSKEIQMGLMRLNHADRTLLSKSCELQVWMGPTASGLSQVRTFASIQYLFNGT